MGEQQGQFPLIGRMGRPGVGGARPLSPDVRPEAGAPVGEAGAERAGEGAGAGYSHTGYGDKSGALGDVSEEDLLAAAGGGGPPPGYDPTQWQRAQLRHLIREFLRSVPRSEERATLALVRLDGSARVLTRAQMSAAIDRLRPRMRQIVRLSLEERWQRQRVCDYLHHISMKTLERDQAEALDLLADL